MKFDLNEAQVQYSSVHIDDFFNFFSLRIAPLLERKGLRYEKDWVNSGQILELDENKLDQILNNLVINAIKFTPSGGKIRVFYHYDHGEFVFGVQDNGVGMSQEAQKKIFTRFWQESSSANRRFRGTGIGLNLVKNMVAAMEGTIAIDSTLGEGTCFTVKLPAKVGQAGNEGDQEAPSSMGVIEAYHKEASFSGAELESYRDSEAVEIVYNGSDEKEAKLVLVADDEPELRVFITECLQEHHRVLACQDGGMAIRLAKEYQPDLIVLDYMMPSMDGIDVVKVLKQDPDLIETPVVMLTARADNELKLRALGQGVLDFLPKPFSPVELQLRISNLLTQDGYKREVQKKSQELEATMEKLVESETKLIQNEQLAALGRMSAGLIHEINNPLNYSKTASTLLKRDIDAGKELDPEDVSDYLEDITEGVERVSEIVADLRGFATNSNMELKVVELQPVLAKSKKLLADQLSQHNIKLTLDMPTSIGVVANELKLSQIFVNMLQNSIYALADVQRDKQIRLTAYEEGERVIVKIWDNGCGIEKDKVQRIFEPFYTTRDVGQGMGLGLSIVSKTLTDFGAELTLHSELQKFTEFILSFEAKER